MFLSKLLLKRIVFLKIISCMISVSWLFISPLQGQPDSLKNFKNTIRFNISNPVLIDWEFNIIGYERVISDHQTFSLSIGRTSFPSLKFNSDSLKLRDQTYNSGIHFSFDYRFYLQKENRYNAPRGIYIGPYYGFNRFSRDITWDLTNTTFNGEVELEMDLTGNLIGMQLGYQFVFWNRFSVDLVLMGPGYWNFNLRSQFKTDLTSEDEAMILERLNELIKENFPLSDMVISGGGFKEKRTTSTNILGFRYMINLGFRF